MSPVVPWQGWLESPADDALRLEGDQAARFWGGPALSRVPSARKGKERVWERGSLSRPRDDLRQHLLSIAGIASRSET
jgi:hypothetical protein